jgi:hypothetical protein
MKEDGTWQFAFAASIRPIGRIRTTASAPLPEPTRTATSPTTFSPCPNAPSGGSGSDPARRPTRLTRGGPCRAPLCLSRLRGPHGEGGRSPFPARRAAGASSPPGENGERARANSVASAEGRAAFRRPRRLPPGRLPCERGGGRGGGRRPPLARPRCLARSHRARERRLVGARRRAELPSLGRKRGGVLAARRRVVGRSRLDSRCRFLSVSA